MSQINHDMVNSINWNDLFIYSKGHIYWKALRGRRKPGSVGVKANNGYYVFNYKCKIYLRHQVV